MRGPAVRCPFLPARSRHGDGPRRSHVTRACIQPGRGRHESRDACSRGRKGPWEAKSRGAQPGHVTRTASRPRQIAWAPGRQEAALRLALQGESGDVMRRDARSRDAKAGLGHSEPDDSGDGVAGLGRVP